MKAEDIKETLEIRFVEIDEEDYPDQYAEYRCERIRDELRNFIMHVIDRHTVSVEERDWLEMELGIALLRHFHGNASASLLRKRLESRGLMSVHTVLHRLWTNAVGQPGYDKKLWLELEDGIRDSERRLKEAENALRRRP